MEVIANFILGDCQEELTKLADHSIDLIVTGCNGICVLHHLVVK